MKAKDLCCIMSIMYRGKFFSFRGRTAQNCRSVDFDEFQVSGVGEIFLKPTDFRMLCSFLIQLNAVNRISYFSEIFIGLSN